MLTGLPGKFFTVVVALLCMTVAAASPLSPAEQRMVEWIDAHSEDAIALLEETVNISSGTMNHEGVGRVGEVMRRELDALGLETEWIELPAEMERAGHLFGRKVSGSGQEICADRAPRHGVRGEMQFPGIYSRGRYCDRARR